MDEWLLFVLKKVINKTTLLDPIGFGMEFEMFFYRSHWFMMVDGYYLILHYDQTIIVNMKGCLLELGSIHDRLAEYIGLLCI